MSARVHGHHSTAQVVIYMYLHKLIFVKQSSNVGMAVLKAKNQGAVMALESWQALYVGMAPTHS